MTLLSLARPTCLDCCNSPIASASELAQSYPILNNPAIQQVVTVVHVGDPDAVGHWVCMRLRIGTVETFDSLSSTGESRGACMSAANVVTNVLSDIEPRWWIPTGPRRWRVLSLRG
jgi:hypothetical protein